MVKRKKACIVGQKSIESLVKELRELPPREVMAKLRKRAAALRRGKSLNQIAGELAVMDAIDAIPADPGEGHPCRPQWLEMMMTVFLYDTARGYFDTCMATQPELPPIVEV